jgi:hypothetical protein
LRERLATRQKNCQQDRGGLADVNEDHD